LSVDELKQRLVNKYKEDTNEKGNIDKKVAEIKKVIDSYKKSVGEIEKEMKNNTNIENAKAHDSIFQKDKEYTGFIDNFDELKKNVIYIMIFVLFQLSNSEKLRIRKK
jgi:hypothetical protein